MTINRTTRWARTAGAAALLACASLAHAAVVFDEDTGNGFVGKGDVQLAFGWNNQALQSSAAGVGFHYETIQEYDAVCVWTTGQGTRGQKTHKVTQHKSADVSTSVAYEMRTNRKADITGFILGGYLNGAVDVALPQVGDACLGEGTNGQLTAVTPTGVAEGGLFVVYGTAAVQIWWPPTAP